MSDQPKNEGEAEDLLSQLFEMDESKKSHPADSLFSEPTKIETNRTSGVQPNPNRTSAAKSDPNRTSVVQEKTDVMPNTQGTVSPGKKSLEDLLNTGVIAQDSEDSVASGEEGDEIFDGILEEDLASPQKMSIFSSPSKSGLSPGVSPVPAKYDENGRDKTIVLQKDDAVTGIESPNAILDQNATQPMPELSDPIDQALSDYAHNEQSRGAESRKNLSGAKSPLLTPSRVRALSGERVESVSAGEFAEGFASEAIQIPDANSEARLTWKHKAFRWGSIGASMVALVGAVTLGFFRIQSDRGLLGYRLDGMSFVKAYRPPSDQELKEFEAAFKQAFEAREADDPKKIEDALGPLKKVLLSDERNLDAASEILEHTSILSLWYGIKSPWGQQYADSLQKATQILEKHPESGTLAALERSKARRNLALGEAAQAYTDLVAAAGKLKALDDETAGLLVELAASVQNKAEVMSWSAKMTRKPGVRVRHFQAVANEDYEVIQELASGSYLPAKVEDLVRQAVKKPSAEKLLNRADALLEEAKAFAPLSTRLHNFRGDLYEFLGDTTKARDEWKPIVEQSPRETGIWIKLARSYEEDALWDDAVGAYAQAKKGKGGLSEESMLSYVRLLRVRGKILDAVSVIDEALKVNPKSALLYYERGLVQMVIYQAEQAKAAFAKALEMNPTMELAVLGMANLAVQQKQWAEAEVLLGKIPTKSPYYPEVLQSLARISVKQYRYPDAERYLTQAIGENPKLETAYPELVDLYLLDEKDSKAEALIKKGLDHLPRSPLLKVSMARVYQFQGNHEKALTELDYARKSFGHLPEVVYAVADVLIDSKQVSQAYDVINPLMEKDQKDAELRYLKARAFYKDSDQPRGVGSNEAAYRMVESAVQSDPQNIRYHMLAAQIALVLQDKNSAIEHTEAVLKIKPHHAQALIVRGDLYRDIGDYEHASQAYLDALKYTRFQAAIYTRLADSFRAQGLALKAIEYYEKVLKSNPSDARAHLELGKLLSDDGRYISSLKSLQTASKLNPSVAETYYFLGFVYKELGSRMDAIRNFEKFLSMEPSGTEASTVRDEIYFLKGRSTGD